MTTAVRDGADGETQARWRTLARSRPGVVAWIISVSGWAVYLATSGARPLLLDSLWYWVLSSSFDPIWAFTDFSDGLRGYSYPWLLGLFADLVRPFTTDEEAVVRLFSLILVPALLCFLVPAIARRLTPAVEVTVPRLVLLNVLFFVSWRQDLLYPLSDIPALCAAALGVWLTMRPGPPLAAGLAGAAWGIALNMRSAYLLAAIVAVAGLALLERDRRRLVLRTVTMLLGIAMVLAPQVAINLEHFDSASPLPERSSSVTRFQLLEGLRLVRYETYRGDDPTTPLGLRFEHEGMMEATQGRLEFESMTAYFGFALQHPFDTGSVYLLHAVNGLDTRFAGTYVEDLDRGVTAASLVNFAAMVLGAATLVARNRGMTRRWRSPTTWFCLVLASACGPAVVGAMETRFLLPLQLTLLAALVLGVRRSDVPSTRRGRLVAAVALGSAILVLELTATWSLTLLSTPV